MTRFVPVCVVLVAAMITSSRVARADDTGMLDGGATLKWDKLKIFEGDVLQEPSDSDTLRRRLNLAHCMCSQSSTAVDTSLYYELSLSAVTGSNKDGQVWVGSECTNDATRVDTCRQILDQTIAGIDQLATMSHDIIVRPYDVINASMTDSTLACRQSQGEASVWVLVDNTSDTIPDFFSPRSVDLGKFTDVTGFDTQPPPLPDSLTAVAGESSINIKWTTPTTRPEDLFAFQAFCIDNSTGAAVGSGADPLYETADTVCGVPQSLDLTPTDITDGAEGTPVTALPPDFASLNPAFICGTENSKTATNLTIKGLENGKEYTVALVAVDIYANPTGAYFTRTVVPQPVTDLWEDIHDRGGKVEGGLFCSAGSADSLPGLLVIVGVALLWKRRRRGCLTVPRRRLIVRTWRKLVGVAGGLVIVLFARTAKADDFTPYWEDHDAAETEDVGYADNVTWHAGIKIGPYTPDIDKQLGKNAKSGMGPYQAMFGNYYIDGKPTDAHVYQIMPMLDVDRVIWRGSGQVAVGGTLGYMQKTAYAYLDGTSVDDPRRPRSSGSENTFRLIPFAATIAYRATQLDDLYGIPIVPYVRGGLSYYVWWIKGPSGDLSKVCKDGSMTMGCDANTAYGGSLGFQGTVGLALRLERIDADAARSMVQSGIYHAGFYGELTFAKVDGFGSDKKLSVGASTWFAGVDFEF